MGNSAVFPEVWAAVACCRTEDTLRLGASDWLVLGWVLAGGWPPVAGGVMWRCGVDSLSVWIKAPFGSGVWV